MRTLFAWLLRRFAAFQDSLAAISPPTLFVAYLFYAILMILLTVGAGLDAIQVDHGQREKGYWWELNWGLNHLIAIPVALFCSASLLRSIREQVNRLADSQMAVNEKFEAITKDDLVRDWERYEVGPIWFGVLATLAFAMSYAEWWVGSASPLLSHDPSGPPVVGRQFGWTTGAMLDPQNVARGPNVLLSFIAFTAQGFVTTVFAYVFATVLAFSIWIYNYGGPVGQRLIPDLASDDERKGFEIFERFVFRLLYVGLAFTVVLFFIRVQSVYDASDSSARTVFHFVLQDVIKGFVSNVAELLTGESTALFDVGTATNYSTRIVFAAMSVMVMIAVAVPTLILSVLARQSKEALTECLRKPPCPPCTSRNLSAEDCKKRVAEMDFWPLRYPRPMELIAYIVFAGFCFLFYKFTFLLLGVLVIQTVRTIYRGLTTPPAAASKS